MVSCQNLEESSFVSIDSLPAVQLQPFSRYSNAPPHNCPSGEHKQYFVWVILYVFMHFTQLGKLYSVSPVQQV